MKIAYTESLRLDKTNKTRLETINKIIDSYRAQGYIMTLRQLYYQLVARDIIANNVKEYRRLSVLLTKGRMAGVVDWAAIEDRGRKPRIPYYAANVSDAIGDITGQYRIDRMQNQDHYIEVWVEKEALSNIFSRVTNKYHVRLMVNKGYSSCSAMHDAYRRFEEDGRSGIILYYGDHDPSGKDMVRDIENRLQEFGLADFRVDNPALTMQQIRQYRLPENPAKVTDPRAQEYIARYGNHSWELDALEPQVLAALIEQSILENIDAHTYNIALKAEDNGRAILKKLVNDEPWTEWKSDDIDEYRTDSNGEDDE